MEQDRNNNMGSSDAFEGLKRLTEMLYENKKKTRIETPGINAVATNPFVGGMGNNRMKI